MDSRHILSTSLICPVLQAAYKNITFLSTIKIIKKKKIKVIEQERFFNILIITDKYIYSKNITLKNLKIYIPLSIYQQ